MKNRWLDADFCINLWHHMVFSSIEDTTLSYMLYIYLTVQPGGQHKDYWIVCGRGFLCSARNIASRSHSERSPKPTPPCGTLANASVRINGPAFLLNCSRNCSI